MNVPLILGFFAIVALPVGLLFWIYDSSKGVKDYLRSSPERKQEIRDYNKKTLKDARIWRPTPFMIFGWVFLAVVVIFIAIGNR